MPTCCEHFIPKRRDFLKVFPVGKSTWWAKVKAGEYPQPVKLGPRTTAWRVEDIRALLERADAGASKSLKTA